jgi:hypothetical protein
MNLKTGCEETVQVRSKWLKEATDTQEFIKQLPNEVQELECGNCGADSSYGKLSITLRCPYELREVAEQLQWVGQTKLLLEQTLGIVWNK